VVCEVWTKEEVEESGGMHRRWRFLVSSLFVSGVPTLNIRTSSGESFDLVT
jgi:hypothetical protein